MRAAKLSGEQVIFQFSEGDAVNYLKQAAAFADAVGRVWVALRDPAAGDDTTEWLVFDGTGTLTGRVALPSGLRLMDAGPDWVVGVETDALDVETVVLAPVAPTASAATLRPR